MEIFQDSSFLYKDLTINSKFLKNIFLLSCLFADVNPTAEKSSQNAPIPNLDLYVMSFIFTNSETFTTFSAIFTRTHCTNNISKNNASSFGDFVHFRHKICDVQSMFTGWNASIPIPEPVLSQFLLSFSIIHYNNFETITINYNKFDVRYEAM